MNRFLLVRSGGRTVGLGLEHVLEMVEVGDPYPVPTRVPALRGLVAVGARLTPVVHLGAFLTGGPCPSARGDVGVLARFGNRTVCLEVDEADMVIDAELVDVPMDHDLPVAAVARVGEVLVPVLHLPALARRLSDGGAAA